MKSVYNRKRIIYLYTVEHQSISAIKRKTGCSRNTIREYIRMYEAEKEKNGNEAAEQFVCSKKYSSPEHPRTALTPVVCQLIEDFVNENLYKMENGLRKQCMNKTDMYNRLVELGCDISYPSVTKYATSFASGQEENKPSPKECFIRQWYNPGEECEFDWGDVKLTIAGKETVLRMAAFCLCYSNHRRGFLYLREDTLSFMESHRTYFRAIGCLPQQMTYDNMRVAVKKFAGTEKEPTDALVRMATFYGFRFRFCNKYSGNEKGHVEKTVDVLRDKAFSHRRDFASIEEAQAYLDKVCEKLNRTPLSAATADIVERAREDFAAMRPCEEDFGCFLLKDYSIDKYATFQFEEGHYSVPDTLVGCRVGVMVYSNKLVIRQGETILAEHKRLVGPGWRLDLSHYLRTMGYKPGAVRHSEALRQAPQEIQEIFFSCFEERPKDFIELLLFAQDEGFSYVDIGEAYQKLRQTGVKSVSLELMKATMLPIVPQDCSEAVSVSEIEESASQTLSELTEVMNRIAI